MTTDTSLSAPRRDTTGSIVYRFTSAPAAVFAVATIALIVLAALLAPLIAPQDPFDPRQVSLANALLPPVWMTGGDARFILGTDPQGRDLFSAILYGSRISLTVGFASLVFAVAVGALVGLTSGFVGGWLDTFLMRVVDVQLTIPMLLTALMVDGLVRATVSPGMREARSLWLLVLAIGAASWPQYARLLRGGALALRGRDYVAAARLSGASSARIVLTHILPNIAGPTLVMSAMGFAIAVSAEATLSFLGAGMSPTTPSLGTLIRIGADYLFSGQWWIAMLPSIVLVQLAVSTNLLGDWLRDVLDPAS